MKRFALAVLPSIIGRLITGAAALMLLLMTAGTLSADTFNINASERGWVCNGSGTPCPNNGASPSNNYSAGFGTNEGKIRDWFEFAIPSLTGGSLVSATLNLDEPAMAPPLFLPPGHSGGPLTFAVYGLGAQPLVFTDVTTSNPFGSVGTSTASNGTTIAITLSSAALAAIAADQGGNIFIGGVDSGENGSTQAGDFFNTGFDPNAPNVTSLSLTTAPAAVPEPASILLLITVVAVTVFAARRKLHLAIRSSR
jgi:hypothetical protein